MKHILKRKEYQLMNPQITQADNSFKQDLIPIFNKLANDKTKYANNSEKGIHGERNRNDFKKH